MDFYILMKAIAFLFLSSSNPTTLVFNEPINYIKAGKRGDFHVLMANDRKTMTIQPLIKDFEDKVLVVVTKNNSFVFRLKADEKYYKPLINVHRGKVNATYRLIHEDNLMKIFEGDSSIYMVNKTNEPIDLNGDVIAKKTSYHSKGVPIYINGKKIL